MRKQDIMKALNYYKRLLPQKIKFKNNPNYEHIFLRGFSNRNYIDSLTRNEKVFVDINDVKNLDKQLRENLVLTYLKTFFGREADSFKTESFKKESKMFNEKVQSSLTVMNRLKKIIKNSEVNLLDFQPGGALEYIVPKELLDQSVISYGAFDAQRIMGIPSEADLSRVYVNPNGENFFGFLNYVLNECIKNEINITSKTRINHPANQLDNLIFYIPPDQLGNFLNILNNYERDNREKIETFSSTPGLMQRNSHNWYGFGLNPPYKIGSSMGRQNETLNDVVDFEYTHFLFPAVILKYFNEIIIGHEREILEYLVDENGLNMSKEDAGKLMNDVEYRENILNEIFDFSEAKKFYEDQENEIKRKNLSTNTTIFTFEKEDLYKRVPVLKKIINLEGGIYFSNVKVGQKNLSTNTYDFNFEVYFQKLLINFLENPDNFNKVLNDMVYYDEKYLKGMPYISDKTPYMSKMLENEIEEKTNIVNNVMELMWNERLAFTTEECAEYHERVNNYINSVGGLDNVILALEYCDGIESRDMNSSYISTAHQEVDKLRCRRTKDLVLSGKPVSELSRFELEDLEDWGILGVEVYTKNMENDFQKYGVYKQLIDIYKEMDDKELLDEVKNSINRNIKNSFCKRKIKEYLNDSEVGEEIT